MLRLLGQVFRRANCADPGDSAVYLSIVNWADSGYGVIRGRLVSASCRTDMHAIAMLQNARCMQYTNSYVRVTGKPGDTIASAMGEEECEEFLERT